MDWREYQDKAQAFFSSLGLDAQTEVPVAGARASHVVDVLVRFRAYGVDHLWVVECKAWQRPIPKERVLTLKGVVDDVGADRGFLLSENGFQSGAVTAARLSNITLTNLEDLSANAAADVEGLRWNDLYSRLAQVRRRMSSLTVVTDRESHFSQSVLKPGVVQEGFFMHVGTASVLERGLERARLGQLPIPYGPNESGDGVRVAADVPTFLDRAGEIVAELEIWTDEQTRKPWPERPTPAPGTSDPATPTVLLESPDDVRGSSNSGVPDGRSATELPQARHLTHLIVEALDHLGGEAERAEIIETAIKIGPFTEEQRAEPSHATRANANHPSELHHRLSWAMSHARIAGEIESVRPRVWRLTKPAT